MECKSGDRWRQWFFWFLEIVVYWTYQYQKSNVINQTNYSESVIAQVRLLIEQSDVDLVAGQVKRTLRALSQKTRERRSNKLSRTKTEVVNRLRSRVSSSRGEARRNRVDIPVKKCYHPSLSTKIPRSREERFFKSF